MAADEIKIEWAKDYFGPDAEMAVQNDNVAQLCYYYRWIKESIRTAKRKGIGDPRLPDDKYMMLYEEDVASTLYRTSDLKLYCMQKAAMEMKKECCINSFKFTNGYWYVKKTWPRNDWYQGMIEHHGQWIRCELPVTYSAFKEIKNLLYIYNSYKYLNIHCHECLEDLNGVQHSGNLCIAPFSASSLLQSQEKSVNAAMVKVMVIFICIILMTIVAAKI